jgi:two-component system, OmpR family, response regulator ChvI
MKTSVDRDAVSLATAAPAMLASVTSKADAIRVLLVEDDPIYRDTLVDELSKQGFDLQSISDSASLLAALDAAVNTDVIVLHCDLPNTSGIDLLVMLRQQGVNVPVVLLAGQALPAQECLAFDSGAADFVGRSRGVGVLARRLRTVIKASKHAEQPQSDTAMICGKLLLRPDVSRAYWNNVDLGLTLGEYKIVDLLASNAGRYVTYRAIYDRMHYAGFVAGSGDHGYRSNVRSCIKRIRLKFCRCDPEFDEIKNYARFGYLWCQRAQDDRSLRPHSGDLSG